MAYAVRRLCLYLLAAWASITLNFVLPRLMPGDPATALVARFRGQLAPEAVLALRNAFGMTSTSSWAQYQEYLAALARGNLGTSLSHFPAPVTEVLATGMGWTLMLGGTAVLLSFALGTALGVACAWRRAGWLDAWLPPILTLVGAFPYFWLAMFALFIFGIKLDWLPIRHAYDDDLTPGVNWRFLLSAVEHALLPATAIIAATVGGWLLNMRNAMLTVLGEDYLLLAHAKGLRPATVMWTYAARNALLPSVTSFGMALGFVLSGSMLTEIVFSYPGLGYLLVEAVNNQDYPLLQGVFLCITLAVLTANGLVDLVTLALDPRTRSRGAPR